MFHLTELRLELKLHVAQAPPNLAEDSALLVRVPRLERDAETQERAGVIPRHGRNELFSNQLLRNRFGGAELHLPTILEARCPRRPYVQEKGAFRFASIKSR